MAIDVAGVRDALRRGRSWRWSAAMEAVGDLANPWGALNDVSPWYLGFQEDRHSLRLDFWDGVVLYTLNAADDEETGDQERLFDPRTLGA